MLRCLIHRRYITCIIQHEESRLHIDTENSYKLLQELYGVRLTY